MIKMSMRTLQITAPDGLVLVGDEMGNLDAPTVVLMHGGGQTRHSWSDTAQLLAADGYHVINYDARGHGQSGWSLEGHYGVLERAKDLRAMIAEVRGPFALVGASMGGVTAMQAVYDGVRPAAVVLVDIVLQPDPVGVKRIFDFMSANPDGFASLADVADAVAAYSPGKRRPASPEGLRKNLREDDSGRLYWHWDPTILRSAQRDADTLAKLTEKGGWGEDLPILLVRGTESDVVNKEGVEHFRRLMPHVEVLDVNGAGHMVAGDQNDPFTRGVINYLGRIMPHSPGRPARDLP